MKAIKKVWNIITTLIVAVIVLLAVVLAGSRLMGVRVFSVLSGSMEPNYPTGSLIFVREVDPFTLAEGDVITFLLDEDTVATHRIVDVVPDETDPSVQCARFRGKSTADNGVGPSAVAGSSAKYWVCSEYGQFHDQCAEYLSYLHRVLRQTCPTSP